MKISAILAIILATVFSVLADYPTVQEANSRVFTNAVIIWKAPTNDLPQSFWIYQRVLPRVFSETIISNAIVLGSLQQRGFPKPSTNDFYIHENVPPNWPTMIPEYFGIRPGDASLYYTLPNYAADSEKAAEGVPNDKAIVAQAFKYSGQLGLVANKLVLKNFYTSHIRDADGNENLATNAICGRGVFLSRQLDGIIFFSGDEEGDGTEGFSIEFGSYGEIRSFSLRWSNVRRCEDVPSADPQTIIQYIKMHKILVLPDANEEDYFTRLQKLASAKTLVIIKITPYYFEGILGKVPAYYSPAQWLTPVAELDAVADFGNSNTVIHLLSPITSAAATRMIENKH